MLCAENFEGPDCTECVPGFTGTDCQNYVQQDFSGNGNPLYPDNSCILCECVPGFTGADCQTNIDDCVGVNCSGNGQCLDRVNFFTCECDPGYTGLLCDTIINGNYMHAC